MAKLGAVILVLFSLVFLAAGVAVWFLPDSAFDGDPFLLKCIVTGATWLIFVPLLYFGFINTTTQTTDVDLTHGQLHLIFSDKHGLEKKRHSHDFSEIRDFELRSTADRTSNDLEDRISSYGQIYLRLSATKGRSLVWGQLEDLRPTWSQMRQDILGR